MSWQYDYVMDETNNGWVNGVPAPIANREIDKMVMDYQINQLLKQQGFREPRNIGEAVYMMFNQGRAPKPKQKQNRNIFPYALGY